QYLNNYPGLKDLIGEEIYPLKLPQGPQLPAVTYFKVSEVPVRDLDGVTMRRARVQFSCWAKKYTAVKRVVQEIKKALQDFQGPLGAFNILDINMIGEGDVYESATSPDPDMGSYHIPID